MQTDSSPKRYAFKSPFKRLLVSIFDFLGSIIWFLFGLRKNLRNRAFKKILVMRIDPLGDLIMTRPALAALRAAYPQAQIDLLVSAELVPLMEDGREARTIYGIQAHWFRAKRKCRELKAEVSRVKKIIRRENYDLAIDFRGDLRNILFLKYAGIKRIIGYGITGGEFMLSAAEKYDWNAHQVLVNLRLLRTLGIQTLPRIYPFTYSAARKERFWKTLGQKLDSKATFRVTFHAGAGLASKCWPQESFREIIEKTLQLQGAEAVLIGSAAEKNSFDFNSSPRLVDLRGQTDLSDLPVLFDACNLHAGNDSGPGHLAAAQGIPVISLFSGENSPEVWKPWGSRALELFKFSRPDEISPAQVFEKIQTFYKAYSHAG